LLGFSSLYDAIHGWMTRRMDGWKKLHEKWPWRPLLYVMFKHRIRCFQNMEGNIRRYFVMFVECTLYSSISLLKWGGILCLILKDGREIMPTYRCKNPSHYWGVGIRTLLHSYTLWCMEVWFMENFACTLTIGKAHGWKTFPRCEAKLGLSPHLWSLIYFGNALYLRALPYM
jgi:hypothetical protein